MEKGSFKESIKKGFRIEAIIIATGLLLLGSCLQSGIKYFTQGQRLVSVKGLAEMQVDANEVTWPLLYKMLSNDLAGAYTDIDTTNGIIIEFLKANGIKSEDISVSAAGVTDMDADRYSQNRSEYRYLITSVVTVSTSEVEKVRALIKRQVELIKMGVPLAADDYRSSVSYRFTDLNKIKPEMVEEATKNARMSAQKFADDSDSSLGKIKRAYQGQFSISDKDANTPYIKTVRVVNTVDYFLKD